MRTLLIILSLCISSVLFSQHIVVKKNGNKIKGVVFAIQYDTLTMMTNGKMIKMHLRDVSSIFFDEYVAYDGRILDNDIEKVVKSGDYTIKYKLKDRKITQIPKVTCATQDKGTVVVTIYVDRYGNVINAEPGGIGSTTTNEYLYAKAQFAAMESKFDQMPNGPLKTQGTITIVY